MRSPLQSRNGYSNCCANTARRYSSIRTSVASMSATSSPVASQRVVSRSGRMWARNQAEGALAPQERLPNELDGVPVDVIESNPEPFLVDRGAHIDPLVGGLEIGNARSTEGAGTL